MHIMHFGWRSKPPNRGDPIPAAQVPRRVARTARTQNVNDEQIARFRVIGGKLMVPGHDPKQPWSLGNFYVLGKAGWRKVCALSGGIHCYDLAGHDGALFAAMGRIHGGAATRSEDGGKT